MSWPFLRPSLLQREYKISSTCTGTLSHIHMIKQSARPSSQYICSSKGVCLWHLGCILSDRLKHRFGLVSQALQNSTQVGTLGMCCSGNADCFYNSIWYTLNGSIVINTWLSFKTHVKLEDKIASFYQAVSVPLREPIVGTLIEQRPLPFKSQVESGKIQQSTEQERLWSVVMDHSLKQFWCADYKIVERRTERSCAVLENYGVAKCWAWCSSREKQAGV